MKQFHVPTPFILHYGLTGIFFLIFFENLGIPLPTEIAYVVGQVLINEGKFNYFTISFILLISHLAGSILSYWLGSRIARGLQKGEETGVVQEKLAGWYKKYGVFAVFTTRLIGQVRPWSSYVAGTAEMPFGPFLAATVVGTLVFNAVALALTGKITHYARLHPWFNVLVSVLFVGGILAVVILQVWKSLGNKKKRKIKG